jgi:transposase
LVDTLGLVHALAVQPANMQDRDGAKAVLNKAKGRLSCLVKVWADGGYRGALEDWVKKECGWVLDIVKKLEGQTTFQVLPQRWKVERTFGWLNHYRLLAKEYEQTVESSETDLYCALTHRMLRFMAN